MNIFGWLQNIDLTDANTQWVLMGSALLGIAASVLGCFAFLRGRSLMGDALAHAALPGVCAAWMFAEWARSRGLLGVESKDLGLLLIGAGLAGVLAAWCISTITRHSRVKEDTAQAIVLSVFFGLGIVLLTQIQHGDSGNQSGLDKFLFGQAASLVLSDVHTMASVAAVLCIISFVLYKEFKLLCFDSDFGNGLGLPMTWLDGFLMAMIVAAVVIGLQAVGVVLMAAMLIIPPSAARFWTEKLHRMIPLAAIFGGFSGASGTLLSTVAPRMPTGPLIVLSATAVFVVSLLFAPRRGALARAWHLLSTQRLVRRENVLRDIFELLEAKMPAASPNGTKDVVHSIMSTTPVEATATITEAELLEKRRDNASVLRSTLAQLARLGWVHPLRGEGDAKQWRLTDAGMQEAYRVVRQHRLWEMFLMYETSLGLNSVDRDADAVEHFLPPEVMGQLETLLQQHGLEPRLKPSSLAGTT